MSEIPVEDMPVESPKRYHPALVTLHWLIVLLVFTNLFIGLFEFEPALRGGGFRVPESLIAIHIAVGLAILILLVVRFIVRVRSRKPAPATAGSQSLNVLARAVHYMLYVVVFAITVVGLIFALQTNRLQRAFFGGGPQFAGPGSGNFRGFPTPGPGTPQPSFGNRGNNFQGFGNQPGGNPGFQGNGFRPGGRGGGFGLAFFLLPIHLDLAIILAVLIGIHFLAAIYHQFILKDNLIGRMWYGNR
ncbi:MAG: cytochrome b [Anaerolineales bacterium]